ncbi:MAG: NUDIX hydrolase [Kofleriaceae bacterium]|nr:NUDIX hydrolase [Kofleriaceae bacterium]
MSKVIAAGVIVVNGPRILAFERFDRPGLALPCGLVEPGESAPSAALREALEETGLVLTLSEAAPFVGFDTVGNRLVYTFLATVSGGALRGEAVGEGRARWASVHEVADGPYWHYNRRALRHFGVRIPLAGKFHSHLTIEARSDDEAARAAKLTYGKLTVIHLSRGDRQQTDYMVTHHYETGSRGLEDQRDIEALLRSREQLLRESGIGVTRLKLEYDVLHPSNQAYDAEPACRAGLYTEVHVKCVVPRVSREALTTAAAAAGWHPSRNPFAQRADDQVVQFINRRFYGVVTLAEVDAEVDQLVPAVMSLASVEEVKYEVAVYDSHDEHDRWWAASESAT